MKNPYVGSKACVRVGNEVSEWFPVRVGLRQGCVMSLWLFNFYIDGVVCIYIPWPFPPVWGVADNTKETTKTMGVLLHSSSSDEGPSRVWMALQEQHSSSSPVSHNLRRFIAVSHFDGVVREVNT